MKKFIAAAALTLALVGLPAAAEATTVPASLHPDVEYALDAVPGGVVIDEYHVVWPELGMELSAVPSLARAVGTCATGTFCAYSRADRGGTKLSWTTCTTVTPTGLSSVGSIANARSSGSVQARTSSGAVLATASAGTSTNVYGTVSTIRCSS